MSLTELSEFFRPEWRVLLPTCAFVAMMVSCQRSLGPNADDEAGRRQKMLERQFAGRDREAITREDVLQAMGTVERHRFMPEAVRHLAYQDRAVPIGHGQTISQPYIVALMTQSLDPRPADRVLEIGTGSGYQAAVLAELVDTVYTIEIVEPLGVQAAATFKELGYTNVETRVGDGYQGWPEEAPFDAIIVTCAPDHVPQPLVDQLKEGGRMVIPVGKVMRVQELVLLEKRGGELHRTLVLPVRFVPMTGEAER